MPESLSASRIAGLAGLAAVVFALCFMSAQYFVGSAGFAAVWPANALILAFMLRVSRTPQASRIALGVAVLAMIAANVSVGRPWSLAVAFPLANAVEIALAAWFMRRTAMPLTGVRDLGQFLLGAVLAGPLASTLLAAAAMAGVLGLSGAALVRDAGGWLLADVVGMAIVAPFALTLGAVRRGDWWRALATPLAIGAVCFLLCWQARLPVLFLAFPLITLAVLRDRDRGGALGVGAVAIAVIVAALFGQGPIARLPTLGLDPVVVIQVFLGALVLTAHPLSAVMRQLDRVVAELDRRRAEAELDSTAKSALIGRVGEEMRSPLSGVVTVAEMLRSGRLGDLNDRQRDLLARIAEGGAEIEALSREMIQLGDGGHDLAPRVAEVATEVAAAVDAARFLARRAKVTIEMLAGDPAWRADVDRERLRRLLSEGLGAALSVAPAGSVVRVVAGLDGQARLQVSIDDAGAASFADRQARVAAETTADAGFAFDRAELRRIGGDLRFEAGALGGGRLVILTPRADAAEGRAAA